MRQHEGHDADMDWKSTPAPVKSCCRPRCPANQTGKQLAAGLIWEPCSHAHALNARGGLEEIQEVPELYAHTCQ